MKCYSARTPDVKYTHKKYYDVPEWILNRIFEECETLFKGFERTIRILGQYRIFLENFTREKVVTKEQILKLMIQFLKENVYTVSDDEALSFDPLFDEDPTEVKAIKMFTRKLLSIYEVPNKLEMICVSEQNNTLAIENAVAASEIRMSYGELASLSKELTNEFSDWEQKCKGINPTGTNYWDGKRIGVFELQGLIVKRFSKKSRDVQNDNKKDILEGLKRLESLGQFSFKNLREFDTIIKKIEEM